MDYIYGDDNLTDPFLKNQECLAVSRPDGKRIGRRNGNILVEFACGAKDVDEHLRN